MPLCVVDTRGMWGDVGELGWVGVCELGWVHVCELGWVHVCELGRVHVCELGCVPVRPDVCDSGHATGNSVRLSTFAVVSTG
jgi:hypothetical protein